MTYNRTTGNKGEDMAVAWLEERGYKIIERNWRHKHWEVDIIAAKKNMLHFFEIKTRTSAKFGHPEESISAKKMQNLRGAAEEYLYQHTEWKLIQFDVLSITMIRGQMIEFFLIEDVFF